MICLEIIGRILSIIEESVTSNLIKHGDFSAVVDTVFESELLEMCKAHHFLALPCVMRSRYSE